VVKGFARYFNEVPKCPLKQKCYEAFRAQVEDLGQNFLEAFEESFEESFPESFGKGFGESLPKPLVIDTNTVADTVTDTEKKKEVVTPEAVVELWNAAASRYGLPLVRKLGEDLANAVKKVRKSLPYQEDWQELFAEIPRSQTLQGRIGDGNWAPTLGWFLKKNQREAEPNYIKALNGAWRDRNPGGGDKTLRRNIENANEALNRMGVPTHARAAIFKGITDGYHVDEDGRGTTGQAGDGAWLDAEYGETAGLFGGSDGVLGEPGHGGDPLGSAESDEVPDHRGFADAYRGER
jgi:hypothetical protein